MANKVQNGLSTYELSLALFMEVSSPQRQCYRFKISRNDKTQTFSLYKLLKKLHEG